MSRTSRRNARAEAGSPVARALAVGSALAATACLASSPGPTRPPAATLGPSVQPVPAASAPSSASAAKPLRPSGRAGLIVHVDPAVIVQGSPADERLRGELRALGAVVRSRVDGAQPALLVDAPADAVGRIRALAGVRAVGAMPDAERWPGLPDR